MAADSLFENPLVTRYASREMAELWGKQRKFSTWRLLWVALAESEQELGLLCDDGKTPRITAEQIDQMRTAVETIDFARAEQHERRLRHDVMAHIHAFGEARPSARDIIHLGATSCYVTDNTDLLLMREGLFLLCRRLAEVIAALGEFAARWRDLPTLGFTHFQPAQLTTVGKRACLWCYDFVLDLRELERRSADLPFRGAKGTTGTQASFLELFGGDHEKVVRLDHAVARKMGFASVVPVCGQTYTRKLDTTILDALSGVSQSAHKLGSDLRLLAHEQEIEEPIEDEQVGSSAMAYKRNPMRAERMCGLARFGMSLPANAAQTAATQWLERTLDDSVNRRLSIPLAFLTADSVLRLALNLARGLEVHPEVIARNVERVLPFMATENILMQAVARGGDRQELHERIRRQSREVSNELKSGSNRNDLLDRLQADPAFARVDWQSVRQVSQFIGRAPQQVDEFLAGEVVPILRRYESEKNLGVDINI